MLINLLVIILFIGIVLMLVQINYVKEPMNDTRSVQPKVFDRRSVQPKTFGRCSQSPTGGIARKYAVFFIYLSLYFHYFH